MFRTAFLTCLITVTNALAAQNRAADSLIALLRAHPQQDTVRVDLLNGLANEFLEDRPDSAVELAREALRISKAIRDPARLSMAALNMGHVQRATFDSAYYYYRMAAGSAREAGNTHLQARAWNDLAYTYLGANFTPAGSTRNAMSISALAYTDSAIQAYAALRDTSSWAYALARKAETLTFLHRYDETYATLQQALRLVSGTEDKSCITIYGSCAGYFGERNMPDSALVYTLKALHQSERHGSKAHIAFHRGCAAALLAELGQYDRAIRMGEEALTYAEQNGLWKERLDAMYALTRIFEQAGRYSEALHWHKLLLAASDSTNAGMAQESISKLQVQLEAVKNRERVTVLEKDRVINEQKRARQRMGLFALGGGTLLMIVLALVIQNRYRLKRRALKESEAQKAIIAKEHARSEELLLNILPEEVAEELKAKGSADAQLIEHVTVLFTDFKGFTAMSEQVTPKALVYDLNECFSAFDHITEKYGIEKIKTIGDAYMAAGGLPTPNTTHATDVINAALEMRDFIAEGKARKVAAGLPYFEIRIGVHTGPVVAGIVGVKKFQYDIWGDTVNTASRMESSGEVGQVNISEATYALVKDAVLSSPTTINLVIPTTKAFTFTPRGKVQAKGKGEMEMYFVVRS